MNIFISGGCKNGKSYHAQELARDMAREKNVPLYYLATMIPHDEEDDARIVRHLSEREGWGFETIEQGTDICKALEGLTAEGRAVDPRGVFLLDSVTALLSNEMFHSDGTMDLDCGKRLASELTEFAARTGNTVFVSDYIYSDANLFDEFTENYRSTLAMLDRTLAKNCDRVIEVTYGFKYIYK
ncbi:MAG: bifunctional adenosylcobinamide kinase/adenosylcobinamide-phosphate guanylyltransferase [Firmicutes bacterium]|nr:bifunctional adenosylcobinamide kinase/adenosylcobinamide-phosphate guanylyltransferase [Bacillota bacterium]